jgi:hypothetical protein
MNQNGGAPMKKSFTPFTFLMAVALFCPVIRADGQVHLPEGMGREIIQNVCTECHTLDRIVTSELSRQEWQSMVAIMVNAGARLPTK